ncbi:MAG: PIN/TRAM domain-containing protein [Planctomycetes bacterium]|nr:PIN/TRAM domain-containing protein [Planctomycetota bacterium]
MAGTGDALEPRRQVTRRVMLHVIRAIFFLVCVGIGLYAGPTLLENKPQYLFPFILGACALGVGLILVEILVISKSPIVTISSIIFGLLGGMVVAILFTILVGVILRSVGLEDEESFPWLAFSLVTFAAIFCYLGVMVLLQTGEGFKFVIPYVEFQREVKGLPPAVLDTSAIIDGRIQGVVRTGIFATRILVPSSVVAELQAISGSEDRAKRARGRRGLDILHALVDEGLVEIVSGEKDLAEPVDAQLIGLASRLSGRLVTNDLGLVKRARLQGVDVVSIHELADALKPEVVAGETIRVRLIRPGEGEAQGVGFLPDGTMVVVEGGRTRIGRDVLAEITSMIQTSAGRMVFARIRPGRPRQRHRHGGVGGPGERPDRRESAEGDLAAGRETDPPRAKGGAGEEDGRGPA